MVAEAVFLVSIVFTGSGNGYYNLYYPMPSMETCIESVKNANINVSNGGDSEGAIALFCTTGKGLNERQMDK